MDNELTLFDRIEVIKKTIKEYGEDNFYLSFSGGKDSTMLHHLLDEALPGNRIPRVYFNTGIEFKMVADFVNSLAKNDDRFAIVKPRVAVKPMLEKEGYPFKSKEHSYCVSQYQRNGMNKTARKYLGTEESTRMMTCPKQLKYQFTDECKIRISDRCCFRMKKDIAKDYAEEYGKPYAITGMRKSEGGERQNIQGCLTNKGTSKMKFHPLLVVDDDFEDWYVKTRNIKLCGLYYPPFNFKRTGCKGCPYALDLQRELDILERLLPNERKQCEIIWKPVYDEYRKLGYRLRKKGQGEQLTIDEIEKGDTSENSQD